MQVSGELALWDKGLARATAVSVYLSVRSARSARPSVALPASPIILVGAGEGRRKTRRVRVATNTGDHECVTVFIIASMAAPYLAIHWSAP